MLVVESCMKQTNKDWICCLVTYYSNGVAGVDDDAIVLR